MIALAVLGLIACDCRVNIKLGPDATESSRSIQSRLFKLNVSDPVAKDAHAAKVNVPALVNGTLI